MLEVVSYQRDFSEPTGRGGYREVRNLDADRRIRETGHWSTLLNECVFHSIRKEAHFYACLLFFSSSLRISWA